MLKFRIALIALLIGCVVFTSCDLLEEVWYPSEGDMPDDMMEMMDMDMHKSWMHVVLPAPGPQAEATSPAETGEVHGKGERIVYINEAGVMALQDASMTTFPAGTMIVKEIMDDTNTFVQKIAKMMKTDDSMYAEHNGWVYKKFARSDENAEYMQVRGNGLPDEAKGCHACHAKAEKDSVFVQLPMGTMEDMGDMGDMDADDEQ